MAKEWAIDIGHGEDTWEKGGGKGVKLPGDLGGGRMEEHYNARKVRGVISIHANAGSHKAHGSCVFYWHTAEDSRKLAEVWKKHASKYMSEVGFHGNGFHPSVPGTWTNLHICRETNMRAILIEHGFMTNKSDLKWLLNDSYRRDCAEVIARTICEVEGITFKPLSGKKSSGSTKPSPSPVNKAAEYKIEKGDTIWGIAKELKVSVEDILKLNPGIDPTKLQIGQTIKVKGTPSKSNDKPKKSSSGSFIGKRVESKVNGLRFYAKPSWSDKDVVGHANKGQGFPYILSKHKVGDGYQYRVKNSKGKIFYITASSKYVTVK